MVIDLHNFYNQTFEEFQNECLENKFWHYLRKDRITTIYPDNLVTIYLCGPMQNCTKEQMCQWRNEVKEYFSSYPHIIFLDPTREDLQPLLDNAKSVEEQAAVDEQIVTKDLYDVSKSDIVLANLHMASFGSPMEVCLGYWAGKCVISVVPNIHQTSSWVRYHSSFIFESMNEACEQIESLLGVNNGK